MAVYETTVEAVERARSGEGPTLVESVTYRMGFHNTTDNPSRYLDPEEYEEAKTRDPIRRVMEYLERLGLWDENRGRQLAELARKEVDQALERALAFPGVTPEQVFDNVYERPPRRVIGQRRRALGRKE